MGVWVRVGQCPLWDARRIAIDRVRVSPFNSAYADGATYRWQPHSSIEPVTVGYEGIGARRRAVVYRSDADYTSLPVAAKRSRQPSSVSPSTMTQAAADDLALLFHGDRGHHQ